MFNFDLKRLKPKADFGTVLIVILSAAIIGVYINYHLVFLIPIFLILYLLIIGKTVLGKWQKLVSIPPILLISITTIITLIIGNFYSYYFFSFNKEYFENITNSMVNFNLAFLKLGLISLITLIIYLTSSISIGSLIIDYLKLKISKLGFYFLSITMGLSLIGTIFFIYASLGFLNLYTSGITFLIFITINLNSIKQLTNEIKKKISTKINVNLNVYKVLLISIILIYISTIIVTSLRSFIYSPDGLRAYLSLTRYLAENNSLPYTRYLSNAPVFTEVLISPAYMFGKIATSIFTLNFLSLLYIIGFYLISKDYIKSKSHYLILVPVILFPPFIQIMAGEFKVDIFFTFISSAVFYTFYKFIKSENIKFAYLSIFFMAIAFLVKMTAIFYILPFGLYLIAKIGVKKALISGLIFLFPIIPWITLYRVDLPYIGIQGLGISKFAKEIPIDQNIHQCLYEIQSYEEGVYTNGFDKGIISYLKIPYYYIKATGTNIKSFSLLDLGILNFVVFFIFLFSILIKRENIIKEKKLKTLGLLGFISLIPWFMMAPIYVWYVAPSIILISLIIYISIIENANSEIKQFIQTITLAFLGIYVLSFSMVHGLSIYFPTGLTAKEAVSVFQKENSAHETYSDNSKVADIVNTDKNAMILFTSAATFANVNFFIDNYYDRSIYLDYYLKTFSEENIKSIISRFNIRYIVINNIAVDSDMKCLSESQKVAKEISLSLGNKVLETSAFTVVELK